MAGGTQRTSPIITLTTDYGTQDHYVGVVKGVLLSIAPSVRQVDITHDIRPHDVQHGAFVLRQIWPWYPKGTIHLVVVDPGVGSDRRVILGEYEGRYVIAPDNGLLTFVHRDMRVHALRVVENRRYFLADVSTTFHGRDIMAPVAAHLANGTPAAEFGRATDRIEILPIEHRATRKGAALRGRVLHIDRFGNLVTNISSEQIAAFGAPASAVAVKVAGRDIGPVRSAFSAVGAKEPVALIGSSGMLEVALNCGDASALFGGDAVVELVVCAGLV